MKSFTAFGIGSEQHPSCPFASYMKDQRALYSVKKLETDTLHALIINMDKINVNELVSSTKPTEGQSACLHPLALLTISEYITRHTSRCQGGPIFGGLLGQYKGREITIEDAFEFKVEFDHKGRIDIDISWFIERRQQRECRLSSS